MNNKKAQAALEFLMTYGWAILVVLAAIGALAYFGVLNPSKFLPDKCLASTGTACVGKPIIAPGAINITFHNGLSYDMAATMTITGTDDCAGTGSAYAKGSTSGTALTSIPQDSDASITIPCGTPMTKDNTIKTDITISYKSSTSGLQETTTISVQGKVK